MLSYRRVFGWKVSEVLDLLTNAICECFQSLEHSIAITHEMCYRMKTTALVNKLSDEERRQINNICPVKPMGLSNLRRMSELDRGVFELFQFDTSTDGVEIDSLI